MGTSVAADDRTTYGLVLPHFGDLASRDSIIAGAREAEAVGYDCLWCRDHMAFTPHPWEPDSDVFVEQYMSLAAAAAVTSHIQLGAGATIPYRSAHHVLALAESLSLLAGRRVNIGLGLGDYAREMALAGLREADIPARRRETFSLLKTSLAQHKERPVELWWAGSGPRSVEFAVDHGANWLAGRQPLEQLRARMARLDELVGADGRRPQVAVWMIADFDARTDRCGERMPAELVARYSGGGASATQEAARRDPAHWRGSQLVGDPDEVRRDLDAVRACGVSHVVLDFRFSPPGSWLQDIRRFHDLFLGDQDPSLERRESRFSRLGAAHDDDSTGGS